MQYTFQLQQNEWCDYDQVRTGEYGETVELYSTTSVGKMYGNAPFYTEAVSVCCRRSKFKAWKFELVLMFNLGVYSMNYTLNTGGSRKQQEETWFDTVHLLICQFSSELLSAINKLNVSVSCIKQERE